MRTPTPVIGRTVWAIAEGYIPPSSHDPEPVPRGTDYASIIEADVPIVVQHSRLDSRQAENALISTVAFPGGPDPAPS